jgi:hypothetical protein
MHIRVRDSHNGQTSHGYWVFVTLYKHLNFRKRSPTLADYAAGLMAFSRSAGRGSKEGADSPRSAASHTAVT